MRTAVKVGEGLARLSTGWVGYAAALGAVALVSLFIGFVLGQVTLANASMLYLIAVLATGKESVDDVKKQFSGNGSAAAAAAEPSQPRTPVRGEQRPQPKNREHEEGGGVPGGPLEQGRAQSRFESGRVLGLIDWRSRWRVST